MSQINIQATRRSLRTILSIIFLNNLGLAVVYPIFTFLILEPHQILLPAETPLSQRMVLLGILIAVFPFAQFIATPAIRRLSDAKGRKFAFTLTLLGEAVGFLCTGAAILFMNFFLLIVGRVVSGLFAGNISLCLQTISESSSDEERRIHNFRIVSNVMGISFVIAIVIGGILSNRELNTFFNSALPFWAVAAYSIINIGLVQRTFIEPSPIKGESIKYCRGQLSQLINIFRTKELNLLYPLFFFFMLGWIIALQFLSSFLIVHFEGTKMMITLTFISVGLAWSIGTMWVNRLIVRYLSSKRILFLSLLLSTTCLFLASEIDNFLLFFHFMVIIGLFASLAWANCLSLISAKAPEDQRGELLTLNQSVATLSMAIAPLFGGLIGLFDIRTIYLFASGSLLTSLILLTVVSLKNAKK
ncbi:MAG: Tetracycline resistance protein, class C [Chlamydiae bacterium]|nr:Tetracycline resistance protein, class C [Chlamydiota bacterium]